MKSYHVQHFGCRAARADGEAVSDRLCAAGLGEVHPVSADVVIVNTCSVTAEADRAARAFIRRTHRQNPAAQIVVIGCYAQRAPEELAQMAGVAAVVGNSHKGLAPEIILGLGLETPASHRPAGTPQLFSVQSLLSGTEQSLSQGAQNPATIWADDRFAHSFLEDAQLHPGQQTRPNLKIQEGCGNRCTFCVIPQTRGASRSLPAEKILDQVQGFVKAGGHELVLSGINLGRWGRDRLDPAPTTVDAPRNLAALVRRILTNSTLARVRLSSVEPMDWGAELIELMAEFGNRAGSGSRLARHAHLPLQSGSDAVLRRMHRRYRPWHYADKVKALLKAAGPELTVGADVMVGFPGESDAEFEETLALIRDFPFGYLHLFPFSPRPGTAAWALHAQNPVAGAVVEQRMSVLRAVGEEKSRNHRKRMIGKDLDAITLHTPAALAALGRTVALTENFLTVEIAGNLEANQLVRVNLKNLAVDGRLTAVLATEITE